MADDSLKRKAACGADGKIWCLPCNYTNNPPVGGSRFGWRQHPFGGYKHHNGVDLSGYHAMPLYATKAGKITLAQYSSSAGNYCILDHKDGTKSVYMHMGKAFGEYPNKIQYLEESYYKDSSNPDHWLVKVGDEVAQGQQIGHMGSTGCSTGTHLHFGIQKDGYWDKDAGAYVDPMDYIGTPHFEITAGEIPIIPEELRVTNTELPIPDDYEAIDFSTSNTSYGSACNHLIRRYSLTSQAYTKIFDPKSNNSYNTDGYGVFGLNSNLTTIPSVEKTQVMAAYSTKNSDGSITYKTGSLSGNDEKLVASYIYSKLIQRNWSHNSILALLANIKAESGLNPARWEQDIDWRKYDPDYDGILNETVYNSKGNIVNYYDGTPMIKGKKFNLGFGLIGRTPWYIFHNNEAIKCAETLGLTIDENTPFDIDVQIESIINYQNNNYYINNERSTYTSDILSSTIYSSNNQFASYFDENRRFPISKTDYVQGKITTDVTLSEINKLNILAVAYCYNAERPAHVNADVRTNYAQQFLEIFGASGNTKLFTPSYEDDFNDDEGFWYIARNKCKYKTRDNFSYCISRANEIMKQICGNESDDLIIPKDTKNWIEYNNHELLFEIGMLPRVGAIACWDSKKDNSCKVAIVEAVSGTHCISISEYDPKENKLIESLITNNQHNWNQSIKDYSFRGFIYIIPDINISDNLQEDEEEKHPQTTTISKDGDGNLIIEVINKTTEDKYATLLFSIKNMKHVNQLNIKYSSFKNNTKKNITGNQFHICLAQQVWNCKSVGKLSMENEEDEELQKNWPFTYFPYKEVEKDDDGKEKASTDPNRYNAPYPAGNLTVDIVPVLNDQEDSINEYSKYQLYEYIEKNKTLNAYDNTGKLKKFIRNHPGYICITVKAPALPEDAKNDDYSSTTLIIKELTLHG